MCEQPRLASRPGLAHVAELTAVVSLLCYSLCLITLLTAVAGAMVGLFISTSERAGHTAHPRPAIERDDSELRLFMVVPKRKYGSPAKNMEAHSAAVPGEKAEAKKGESHKPKVLARAHNNDVRWGYTSDGAEARSEPSSLFSTGDPDWR
jgi:hypothetical protein